MLEFEIRKALAPWTQRQSRFERESAANAVTSLAMKHSANRSVKLADQLAEAEKREAELNRRLEFARCTSVKALDDRDTALVEAQAQANRAEQLQAMVAAQRELLAEAYEQGEQLQAAMASLGDELAEASEELAEADHLIGHLAALKMGPVMVTRRLHVSFGWLLLAALLWGAAVVIVTRGGF